MPGRLAIRKDIPGKRTGREANFGDMLYDFGKDFGIPEPLYGGLFDSDRQREIVKEIRTIVGNLVSGPESGTVRERNKAGETGFPPRAMLSVVLGEPKGTGTVGVDERYGKWMGV